MAIVLDHLAIFAPDLATGVAYVRDVLGATPAPGGQHPQMGTHNALLRLGADVYLEIIACDPAGRRPDTHKTWFELGDPNITHQNWNEGRRLRGMVASTREIDRSIAVAPTEFGQPMRLTRGANEWTFDVRGDGHLPGNGTLPHLIDRGQGTSPASRLPDAGCKLLDLVLETPANRAEIARTYAALRFQRAPRLCAGRTTRLIAAIETPSGVRILG